MIKLLIKPAFLLGILLVSFTIWISTQSKPVCTDCNVLIVAYDALQAAHVSHLGYKRETTPTLDVLAKEGVSFANAISPSSWTVPSYMSIFTGLYPSQHKVVNKFTKFNQNEKIISNLNKLSPNVETLAQVFKANGYITGGFTGDAGVHSMFGYNKGFDVYTDEKTFGSIQNASDHALNWLKKNKNKQFFMFLHGYDSHGQFKVPDNYKGKFMPKNYDGPYKGTNKEQRDLREEGLEKGSINLSSQDVEFWRGWYDSKIRDADDRFAKFWSEFAKMGLAKNTLVVILSDHGTEFYEHKRFDHGHTLYDELVHIPLVFLGPGIKKSLKVKEQVTTIDLAPTILELMGINPSQQYKSQMQGKSLANFLKGSTQKSEAVFIETDYRNYTHKRSIRTVDGWKFILTLETGQKELYDLNKDPHELKNVIEEYPKMGFDLEQRIREHMAIIGEDPYKKYETGCLPVYADQCQ